MRSQPSFLLRLSPLCLALVAACSSPRSSGPNPETDAGSDVGVDAPAVPDAPADVPAADVPAADAPVDAADDATVDVAADVVDAADAPADAPADA
ncbi:MAG: hypothetical protein JWM10_1273, partial [Myxococcaceae bacterium]|nr:hypothetical protein [Myxococcaceae bacterium]